MTPRNTEIASRIEHQSLAASMRPWHDATEYRPLTSPGNSRAIIRRCERCAQAGLRWLDCGHEIAFHDLITRLETTTCPVASAAVRFCATGVLAPRRRAVFKPGAVSIPGAQTMIGSRATASKRLPRLSTRSDSLSAGPKSRITT